MTQNFNKPATSEDFMLYWAWGEASRDEGFWLKPVENSPHEIVWEDFYDAPLE